MRNLARFLIFCVIVIVLAAIAGAAWLWTSLPAPPPMNSVARRDDGQQFARIERGRYLAIAADCASCHTRPGGAPFAGGRAIETPFGNVVAANITPDLQTGIGAWSDDDFDAAVRYGRGRGGSFLYPAMPFAYYARMTRDDALAIRAYLATVAPSHNPVVSDQLPFPFNIRASMTVWDALYFKEGVFQPAPSKSAAWNRGAYLVEGPGHCGACHTPKTWLGGDEASHALDGYSIQGWFAPDITNQAGDGLQGWSVADISAYLKTGHNRMDAATGPMAEEVELSSAHMTDSDLTAIATYLKDQSGGATTTTAEPANSGPESTAGAAIYRDSCSACHAINGEGEPYLYPDLANSPAVRAEDPQTLIRVVLRGARSAATAAEPTAPGMPAYGWQLDDQQVAAVLSYIRSAWGAKAPPIGADRVRSEREALARRND